MEGGFLWGFFLGVIGIIIVAVRPNDNASNSSSNAVKTTPNVKQANRTISESEAIKYIKEYKDLYDAGILTEEEFVKKKTLLLEGAVEDNSVENVSSENNSGENEKPHDLPINGDGNEAVYFLPADKPGYGTCPKCNSVQPRTNHSCWKCCTPLMFEED